MTDDTFKKGLAVFTTTFTNIKPSDETHKTWFMLLRDLTNEEYLYAVMKICREVTSFYPTDNFAALIREQLTANIDNEALLAWIAVKKATVVHGAYTSVMFSDTVIHSVVKIMATNWEEFCQLTPDTWMQKDFKRNYKAMTQRDDHPKYLAGIFGSKSPRFIETHTRKRKALEGQKSIAERKVAKLAQSVVDKIKQGGK